MPRPARPSGAALLLSRVGASVSQGFAERLAPLGLTPAQVGVLRVVAGSPGLSQLALAERIGSVPSRVVRLLDELEDRGLVERRRSAGDRRQHEVHLAGTASETLAEVRRVVAHHDRDVVAPLSATERDTLVALLGKLATARGLADDEHPGYRPG